MLSIDETNLQSIPTESFVNLADRCLMVSVQVGGEVRR